MSPDAEQLSVAMISLAEEPGALRTLRKFFPGAVVVPAVDERSSRAVDLYRQGRLGLHACCVLHSGRRHWHHEFVSGGAVGLHASNSRALAEDAERWLLLCEEDLAPAADLATEVELLMQAARGGLDFDLAVVGPTCCFNSKPTSSETTLLTRLGDSALWQVQQATRQLARSLPALASAASKLTDSFSDAQPPSATPCPPRGWAWLEGGFFGTHCVLWSPRGRRRASELLKRPQEMQLDAFYAAMHGLGELNCLVQMRTPGSATQQDWPNSSSTIQADATALECVALDNAAFPREPTSPLGWKGALARPAPSRPPLG